MGALFGFNHINFVAYLTAAQNVDQKLIAKAPRSDASTLRGFLGMFAWHDIDKNTVSSGNWHDGLGTAAATALGQLSSENLPDDIVLSSRDVANALDPLIPFFSGYKLYILIIPPYQSIETMEAIQQRNTLFQFCADEPGILVLMPRSGGAFVNVIDPFPALKGLAWSPVALPAAVFWTARGTTLALNLEDARVFFKESLAGVLSDLKPKELDSTLEIAANARRILRLLHISDIHIGHKDAEERITYLEQNIVSIASSVDRVVLSGDLFDSPTRN
jgi:hypothetical protein